MLTHKIWIYRENDFGFGFWLLCIVFHLSPHPLVRRKIFQWISKLPKPRLSWYFKSLSRQSSPSAWEGKFSVSDFRCLRLLVSERRHLGVRVGRRVWNGETVTLSVVVWSPWGCLLHRPASCPHAHDWSPELVSPCQSGHSTADSWPICSHSGTCWLWNAQAPKANSEAQHPIPSGTEVGAESQPSGRLTPWAHGTTKGMKCLVQEKSEVPLAESPRGAEADHFLPSLASQVHPGSTSTVPEGKWRHTSERQRMEEEGSPPSSQPWRRRMRRGQRWREEGVHPPSYVFTDRLLPCCGIPPGWAPHVLGGGRKGSGNSSFRIIVWSITLLFRFIPYSSCQKLYGILVFSSSLFRINSLPRQADGSQVGAKVTESKW